MTEIELAALCAAITPPDEAARAAAHAHWASLAKPLGGLGGLETTIEDAAALTGSAKLDISRRAVLVFSFTCYSYCSFHNIFFLTNIFFINRMSLFLS